MERVLAPRAFRVGARVTTSDDGSVATIRLGRAVETERDVEALRRAVTDALHDGAREVVVDFAEVPSLRVEGVAALLVLKADAERYGVRVRVDGTTRSVRRKLRTTGALPHLR